MKKYICILLSFFFYTISFAQVDSIYDQGTYRTFIVHLPLDYAEDTDYPLVFNFHGLGSNANEQRLYSQFDDVADAHKFIVVYPDAINNSWDLFGTTDNIFLSNLVDSLHQRYSLNDCIFMMGMSQGGFLSYKFACDFAKPVSAIAVVTGNMLEFWQSNCAVSSGMPVMHFHGTADQVVLYNGSFGISPVEETIEWWSNENNCNPTPVITDMPDVNSSDGSTAQRHRYQDCDDGSEVILYKILEGGHTWPGAFHLPSFGNTNQDIDASELIGDFFHNYCTTSTGLTEHGPEFKPVIYPNPAHQFITIMASGQLFHFILFDVSGKLIIKDQSIAGTAHIDTDTFANGLYFIELISADGLPYIDKVIISH